MRLIQIPAGIGLLLTLSFTPVYAGQKGNSGNHGGTTTTHAVSTTTNGSATAHGPVKTTHGPSAKATSVAPKASSAKSTKTKAGAKLTDTKSVKSKKTATTTTASTSTSATSTSTSTGTSTTTTTVPTIDFTSGAVGSKLSKNTALRSKIASRLTAQGYTGTVYQAAYGFKNLGQFVAATNVSRNLGVSFEKLKIQMTGLSVKADGTVLKASLGTDGKVTMVDPASATNPAPTKSLGQSIQTVKSNVDATAAATTATTQADAEIASTSTTVSK